MVEVPLETKKLLDKYKEAKQTAADNCKDGNAIDEGLTPIDVNFIEAPDVATLIDSQALSDFNKELKESLPSWINAYYKVEGKNDPKPVLKVFVSEIALGDKLIQHDHLISFPMLKEGGRLP